MLFPRINLVPTDFGNLGNLISLPSDFMSFFCLIRYYNLQVMDKDLWENYYIGVGCSKPRESLEENDVYRLYNIEVSEYQVRFNYTGTNNLKFSHFLNFCCKTAINVLFLSVTYTAISRSFLKLFIIIHNLIDQFVNNCKLPFDLWHQFVVVHVFLLYRSILNYTLICDINLA